jgi:3-hydroxyacyl-CoA dehydrogenase
MRNSSSKRFFEEWPSRREVFTKLDAVVQTRRGFWLDTSYLNVDDIAAITRRPQDVKACTSSARPT